MIRISIAVCIDLDLCLKAKFLVAHLAGIAVETRFTNKAQR